MAFFLSNYTFKLLLSSFFIEVAERIDSTSKYTVLYVLFLALWQNLDSKTLRIRLFHKKELIEFLQVFNI